MKKYRHAPTPKYRSWGYKKSYRIKKKKSILWIFKSKIFLLFLLFLIISGTIFYFVVFSSFFQIKEIKISGNKKVSAEEIRNNITKQVNKKIIFFNTKSIFLADLKEINEILLEKFPRIAKVDLNREFPGSLSAQIEERKPVAVFCNSECFFIDKNGVIFENISEIPSEILIIKTENIDKELNFLKGAKILEKEQLNQILKINSKLKDDLKIPVEEILAISKKRINAKTSEGWEIYFNPERDLEWQLAELSILLKKRIPPEKRKNIEYIDLRFDKIFIFPETYLQ